jgi:NAD(P)-dependent dehydrogenase (short-subunit alcohol dehydrogenase family)
MNSSTPEFLKGVQPLLDAAAVSSNQADPEEMAHGVSFLCEDKSRWITGVCLPINGGFFMY